MRSRDENAVAHDVFDRAKRAKVFERIFRGHDHVGVLAHLERSRQPADACHLRVDQRRAVKRKRLGGTENLQK